MPVLIAAARRAAFTRVDGALAGWHPVDLAAEMMNATVADPASVDEVWVGCAEPVGAQGADMARAAVLAAGWPDHIGGTVVDRAETSGSAALHAACAALEAGEIRRAVVVGVGCASVVAPGASALGRTYGPPWGDGPAARVQDQGGLLPAPVAADRAAAAAGIGRSTQEDWALRSHRRRAGSPTPGVHPVGARPGARVATQRATPVTADEPRPVPAGPADLPPSFDPDGAVTGFTFAPPADGVAVVELTVAPHDGRVDPGAAGPGGGAVVTGRARGAGHPLDATGGAASTIEIALDRAGLTVADIGRWEITEPTAAAALLVIEGVGLDPATVNIGGGTLGVGDAGAAEEIRLVVDAVYAPASGDRVGVVTFGLAGAAATIIERS